MEVRESQTKPMSSASTSCTTSAKKFSLKVKFLNPHAVKKLPTSIAKNDLSNQDAPDVKIECFSDEEIDQNVIDDSDKDIEIKQEPLDSDDGQNDDEMEPSNADNDQELDTVGDGVSSSRLTCAYCGRTCRTIDVLREHVATHTGEKPFLCHLCGKCFAKRRNLRNHHETHLEKPHSCDICGSRFTRLYIMKRHRQRHLNEVKSNCHKCGAKFKNPTDLQNHDKMMHSEDSIFDTDPVVSLTSTRETVGEFPCDTCGKRLCSKRRLKHHLRIHTGERPCICEICGKAFRIQSEVVNHKRMVHSDYKPYECSVCGKSFVQAKDLDCHERIHTGEKPFSCRVCGKRFRQRGHLSYHYITHTGEKRYQCKVCGLNLVGNLRTHMMQHSNEAPVECDVCGKSFKLPRYLARHKKETLCSKRNGEAAFVRHGTRGEVENVNTPEPTGDESTSNGQFRGSSSCIERDGLAALPNDDRNYLDQSNTDDKNSCSKTVDSSEESLTMENRRLLSTEGLCEANSMNDDKNMVEIDGLSNGNDAPTRDTI